MAQDLLNLVIIRGLWVGAVVGAECLCAREAAAIPGLRWPAFGILVGRHFFLNPHEDLGSR